MPWFRIRRKHRTLEAPEETSGEVQQAHEDADEAERKYREQLGMGAEVSRLARQARVMRSRNDFSRRMRQALEGGDHGS
jgi:hypothetical protein